MESGWLTNFGKVAILAPAETYEICRSSANSKSHRASTTSFPIISATWAIERPSKRWFSRRLKYVSHISCQEAARGPISWRMRSRPSGERNTSFRRSGPPLCAHCGIIMSSRVLLYWYG